MRATDVSAPLVSLCSLCFAADRCRALPPGNKEPALLPRPHAPPQLALSRPVLRRLSQPAVEDRRSLIRHDGSHGCCQAAGYLGKGGTKACAAASCLLRARASRIMRSSRRFVVVTRNALDQAAAKSPNPGGVTLHRLNRAEYVEVHARTLRYRRRCRRATPGRRYQRRFRQHRECLKVSPSFLDQYINAARAVSRQAIGEAPHAGKAAQCTFCAALSIRILMPRAGCRSAHSR